MSLSVSAAEILVSDLPTKSVTLTPIRATVVREFKTTIQPGQNEITILGIDPKVDVDSIRVDGSGPATITDIQTQKVPRRETFEDVYPEDSDDDELSDQEPDSDADYGIDDSELQVVRTEIASVEATLAKARGNKAMSLAVSSFMDGYGKNLKLDNADAAKLNDFLQLYVQQHSVECERHHKSTVEIQEAEKSLERLQRKRARLETAYDKAKEAALKDIREQHKKRLRERTDKLKKQQQLKLERQKFWTTEVSQVVVHLDSHSALTPGSSRRSSIVGKPGSATDEADVTLRLAYVIPGPRWVSRYDLRISTPSASAQMIYRAEFQNTSAETWSDTQVTLSTSQASFSGLDEPIPHLQGWHIKLEPNHGDAGQPSWDNILRSLDESGHPIRPNQALAQQSYMQQLAQMQRMNQARLANIPRTQQGLQMATRPPSGGLFGASSNVQNPQMMAQQQACIERGEALHASAAASESAPPPPPAQRYGAGPAQGGLFGAPPAPPAAPMAAAAPQPASLFGAAVNRALGWTNDSGGDHHEGADDAAGQDDDDDDDDDDDTRSTLAATDLEHQDSVKQDYGLTTTYDLPGRRTLIPSSVSRRHVLAELELKSLTLTHIIVPRVRAAAFLRARIQNTTAVGILRGRAGMTVDGTFLGTTNLPNCAPNDAFNISLGVDPSILVTYAKPSVRRVTGGFFSKEHTAVFRRACWVKNTKGATVDLIITDQVPQSEDEKLRVQILEPSGLEKEGDQVRMTMEKGKGRGSVALGKNGEVKWLVKLEPGKDIRLVLEYETKVPQGSQVELTRA
ncbi:uncharacterized protein ACLA_048690 [Aspergillus clavatus NRRL 1]|uniref:Mucoidy inhibitor A n=1 Tax=Aspergillus clavatus (strain ATCC 1007 / CBS 513.65 / DSM 816 / NCTC 3887 / NRRL 1 / QM 1276 / 107) TaxID=344612 RepID=A1CHP2_ASPCL|nr:uncharacterized protein ACLA_048690 [Aspergillus clavatus NRRL 1]EAW10397.1 conserved hypothetical protein [Aspergillus clavatus NRRL 1]